MLASASDNEEEKVKVRDKRAINIFFILKTLAWSGDILKAKIVSSKVMARQDVKGACSSAPRSLSENSCLVSRVFVKQNLRNLAPLAVFAASLGLLSGCAGEEAVPMPAPQITRYVLDLSGSNDYMEQYRRLKPVIYSDLSSESLGDPYQSSPKGPKELSITFILESASRASVVEIASAKFGLSLYEDLSDVYDRSVLQKEDDWGLVLAAYRDALQRKYVSSSMCINSIWQTLFPRLGEVNSKDVASKICKFTVDAVNKLEKSIPDSLSPGGGSDVFGSLREIESWAKKLKGSRPNAVVNVVIASDMVHNTDGLRDFFGNGGILTNRIGKDEVCEIAKEQAALSALEVSDISFTIIGRGNASSVSGDEGEALAIFWKCFADISGFEINFVTDGNG